MSLVFGKYEKIRRIAQGGMGEVYLARQTGVLDRLAILKSLRSDLATEKELVEQFLDEARVAATLNHPNIVSIFDVGEWHGTYYIAMEYVPGEDLSKLWYAAAKAGVGLPFQVSVRVCFEAAHGLDHAHKAKDVRGSPLNIVHRDVSPQNIMVRGDGVVKLVDFGIAKAANKSSRTQAGMVKGKLQYMSPEQVRGEALDGRSDQFSLGVVLWEMCTGRRLFKADSEINTLQKILQSPIPKPSDHVPGFPPELEATILKMLQRDAEKRYKDVGAVANDLKIYLDRSSMSSGNETSVAGFVQQILGKELEDRIADLTPMEPTEAGAPIPQPKQKTQEKVRAAQAQPKVPPNEQETLVVNNDEDNLKNLSTGPKGDWQVKKQDGSVVSFSEMSTLHQGILDGQVVGEDSFTSDGKSWKKLKDAPQFAKFLEIALAAKSVATQKRPATATVPNAPQPAPQGPSGTPQSTNTVTRPIPAAARDTLQLPLEALNNPKGGNDPMTGAFSLGDLPPSQTGTWGAPDIAKAVAAARAAHPANANDDKDAKSIDGLTPTTRAGGMQTPEPLPRAARIPTVVWMLGGIAVALSVVVGSLALFAPELLASFFKTPLDHTEVIKAAAAARDDDPGAIDALLKDAEALAISAPEKNASDAAAAAALLHLARARIDDEAARLTTLAGAAGAPSMKLDAAASAEQHRLAAYKLATRAVAAAKDSPGGLLALAVYQGESGAVAELESDATRAVAAAKGTPVEALVTSEIELSRNLLAARGAMDGTDAAAMRTTAAQLSAADDARARSVARLVRAKAASLLDDQARDDVTALKTALRELDAGDPRVTATSALVKALEKKINDPKFKPTNTPTNTPTNVADAGVARVADAGVASVAKVADAGVAGVASVDAGPPPPPETYETAFEKAKKAQKRGSAKETARWAKKALELKPGTVEAQLVLGFAYTDLGTLGSASTVFRQVLSKEPKNCDALIGIAIVLDQEQKTEDARKGYMTYVESCPDGKDIEAAKGAISRLE